MEIIKSTGQREVFEREKFCDSLRRAGAPDNITDQVCKAVEQELTPGMSTTQIFRKASKYLMQKHFTAGVRYSVRRGLELLGPAGFIFEQFVEVLLHAEGFETRRNQMIAGECVTHEVDVLAEKNRERYIVEAKYHNQRGLKTVIEPVMYGNARTMDIARGARKRGDQTVYHFLMVTNTKFSGNAVAYARCRGFGLIGWQYPQSRGLEDLIAKHLLFPVTSLPSVDRTTREVFAHNDLMLVRDLAPFSAADLARLYGIDERKARVIIKEAHVLIYGREHSDESAK